MMNNNLSNGIWYRSIDKPVRIFVLEYSDSFGIVGADSGNWILKGYEDSGIWVQMRDGLEDADGDAITGFATFVPFSNVRSIQLCE